VGQVADAPGSRADSDGLNWTPVIVTRGLDPRLHLFRKKMDCRVKPGNDERSQCKRKTL
jgi:hypothetical protein